MVKPVVDARTLVAPRLSLLTAVSALNADGREEEGVLYSPEPDGDVQLFEVCGDWTLTPATAIVDQERCGFTITYTVKCSTFSRNEEENVARARRGLAALQSQFIASELWNGTLAQTLAGCDNPYFADSPTDIGSGSVLPPVEAVGAVEAFLATTRPGIPGAIHATPRAATYLKALDLIERSGDLLVTALGTPVIVDAGYGGTILGITDAAASSVLVASSVPRIWLGPVQVSGPYAPQLNEDNTVQVTASRNVVVDIEPGLLGAVKLNLCTADESC